MRTVLRFAAAMIYPLCYVILAALVFRTPPDGRGLADVGGLLFPSVVIYLIALTTIRRRLGLLTIGEIVAGSLIATVLAPASMCAFVLLIYSGGGSQLADYAFFFVLPFVIPFGAFWVALRSMELWHRRRVGARELPA